MTSRSLHIRLICLLFGMVLGGFVVWVYTWGNWHPYYEEDETFFRGKIGEKEVVGIYYHEFHGLGFLDSGRWKVVIRGYPGDGGAMVLYQKAAAFQEPIPHQPSVEIRDGNRVLIDDGEDKLSVLVEASCENKRPE